MYKRQTHAGPELGNAVADTLLGKNNPAARCPITWYRSAQDLPDIMEYDIISADRTYLYDTVEPLFPFGHGLSYSSFVYRDFTAEEKPEGMLFRLTVENTSQRDGDEVVQLYVSHPDAPEPKPIRTLKGVKRIHLQPGEEQIVEFTLTPRNLALVDVDGTTACCPGRISFYIGGSQPVSEADRRQHSAEIRVKGPRRVLAR